MDSADAVTVPTATLVGRVLLGAVGVFLATWWMVTAADAWNWGWWIVFFFGLAMTIGSLWLLVWCGRSIIRIHRSYPLDFRHWLIIIWVATAAIMLAVILRVWTIHVSGPNIGAMFLLVGLSGMTLPGLLFLLGAETNRLVPERSYPLMVGSVLAVIMAYPSIYWALEFGLSDLFIEYRYAWWLLNPALGILSVFTGNDLFHERLVWFLSGVSSLILIVTGLIVLVSRIRERYIVRPVTIAVVWLILVSASDVV